MFKRILEKGFLLLRKIKYSIFSNNDNVIGKFRSNQPVVIRGIGKVGFGNNVSFGVVNSQYFYSSYAYIEARTSNSEIAFGNNVQINNGFSVISEKKITIEDNVLIGFNCHIIDSSFHDLNIKNRLSTDPNPKAVKIGRNVFIGNNVTILKGVSIGENTVIAAGTVVTKPFPKNVIIGGVPAKIIGALQL